MTNGTKPTIYQKRKVKFTQLCVPTIMREELKTLATSKGWSMVYLISKMLETFKKVNHD